MTPRTKNIASATGTFFVALTLGIYLQHGEVIMDRIAGEGVIASMSHQPELPEPTTEPERELALFSWADSALNTPKIVPISLSKPFAADDTAVLRDCSFSVTAQTLPMAFVALSVSAPCDPMSSVQFHHQGITFSQMTDEDGNATAIAPALAEQALFMVTLANGDGAVASSYVPEIALFDRVVMQWDGPRAAELHALEFGASYNSDGHIWNAKAGDVDFRATPTSGFMMTLGYDDMANPHLAEVYTIPSQIGRSGTVELNVDIAVTAENCGQSITVSGMQISKGQDRETSDLAMTLPDCDAIGSYLQLKNMFGDLTL